MHGLDFPCALGAVVGRRDQFQPVKAVDRVTDGRRAAPDVVPDRQRLLIRHGVHVHAVHHAVVRDQVAVESPISNVLKMRKEYLLLLRRVGIINQI